MKIITFLILTCCLQRQDLLNTASKASRKVSSSYAGGNEKWQVGKSYYVKAYIDHIRALPNKKSQIVCDFSCGYLLKVIESPRHKWVKVKYTEEDVSVAGYIPCASLSEQPVHCKF